METKYKYSYEYCWETAHILDLLLDHQKSFFAPPKDTKAIRGIERRHPAEIERDWYNDPLQKLYFRMLMKIENIYPPTMTMIMSKEEFNTFSLTSDS